MLARRQDLLAALVSCADTSYRAKARRFANGLSADELQFIVEFLGASILDAFGIRRCSRAELAERVWRFQQSSAGCRPEYDRDHKSILLLEFLCRSGLRQTPSRAGAGMN